jgi:4-amino-4-deoxy-L-arabinose transferase-like glycosyltransferase
MYGMGGWMRSGRIGMKGFDARQLGIVAALSGIVMLTNLGGPRLWDRDEPRNAGCAREMLDRGDWIVPTFNASLRTHKPVLLYWLIMSAYSVLGVNEFSARLPSALCAVGTCIATFIVGRRLFPSTAGLLAAIALATSVMFVVAGRAATPDSVLIFCTTTALAVYVCGAFRPRNGEVDNRGDVDGRPLKLRFEGNYFPQDWRWQAAIYGVMGLAVLAKGPVGMVLPTAVIGMFLLIMRTSAVKFDSPTWSSRLRTILRPLRPLHFLKTCWYMNPLLAIAMVGAIALPWYIAVGLQTDGAFLRGFFLEHNLERATRPMEGHDGGPLFYPVAILVGCFPWSIFAVPVIWDTLSRLRKRDESSPALIFCLCWIGVYVGLFSLARTKLPSYVTPCYPAVALLIGRFVDRWRRGVVTTPAWLPRAGFGLLAFVGLAMLIGLPIAARRQLPGEELLAAIGLVPLMVGIFGLLADRSLRRMSALYGMVSGSVALAVLIFAVGAHRVSLHQKNGLMLESILGKSPSPKLASFRTLEPTWVFYGKHPIRELPTTLSPAMTVEGGRASAPVGISPADLAVQGRQQAIDFLSSSPDAYLITTSRRLAELQPVLPADVEIVSDTPLFLKKDRLVALRRKPPGQSTVQVTRQQHLNR